MRDDLSRVVLILAHSSVGGGKTSRVLNIRSVLSSKTFRIVAMSKRA
jgi:hypothetical protein